MDTIDPDGDTIDHGRPPARGWGRLVTELLVEDLVASLRFWCDVLGFACAYRRPAERFVYLERPDGAQIMLCERADRKGGNETDGLERPFGRGVMFQLVVDDLEPVREMAARRNVAVREASREVWRRTGDRELGRREIRLLDPDGYLVMVAQEIGVRPLRTRPP